MKKMNNSEQFHNMNATVETVQFDDGRMVKRLVSYSSVVVDICLETGTIFLYPRYQYSPTTIRQVTRFLNDYMPLDNGWSISLIRELRKKAASDDYTTLGRYSVFYLDRVIGSNRSW